MNNTTPLGKLGLQEQFRIPENNTIYKTITYPFSFVNHTVGTRECLNMTTLKAERLKCRREVEAVECSTIHKKVESSEVTEK